MALNKDFRVKDSLYVSTSGYFANTDVSIDTGGSILSAGTDLLDIFQDTNLASLTDGACIADFTYDGDCAATVAIESAAYTSWDYAGNNITNAVSGICSCGQGEFDFQKIGNASNVNIDLGLQPADSPTFAGLTLNGEIDMTSDKIVNVADPTNDQDAATKAYVDNLSAGTVSSVTAGNATIDIGGTATDPTVRIADACVTTLSSAFCAAACADQGATTFTRLNGTTVCSTIGLGCGDNVTFNTVDGTSGVCGQNVQVGVTGACTIDTSAGNLVINSAGGTTCVNDAICVTGAATFDAGINAGTLATGNTCTVITRNADCNLATRDADPKIFSSTTLIDGTGTSGKLTKFTGTETIGDSIIEESGSKITVGGDHLVTGDSTVYGNLSVTGDFTCIETTVSTTSALSVTNTGTGPALFVSQGGTQPIAHFIDQNGDDIVFADNGYVGIGTFSPAEKLTVAGSISANSNAVIDGTITNSGLVAGTTNTVVISDSDVLKTRDIDSRTWGTTLVSKAANLSAGRIPVAQSCNTICNSNITDSGSLVTIDSNTKIDANHDLSIYATGGSIYSSEKTFTATVGTGGTTVATFAKSGFDAGKYVVTLINGVNKTVFEVLVAYNGTNSFGTVYGIVDAQAASQLVTIDVSNTGSTIDLVITSASASTTAIIHGKAFY